MSLGTGALKVSGEGPEVIQAPQEGLHGNPASGNHPSSSRYQAPSHKNQRQQIHFSNNQFSNRIFVGMLDLL